MKKGLEPLGGFGEVIGASREVEMELEVFERGLEYLEGGSRGAEKGEESCPHPQDFWGKDNGVKVPLGT